MGLLDGKRIVDHRRPHRRVPRLRRGPAGPGRGGRDRAVGGRARAVAHPAHGPQAPRPVDVLEIDVTDPDQLEAAADDLTERWGRLDGLLHAIGFAPQDCLGGDILRAEWDDVAVALEISAYSLKALVGRVPTPARGGRAASSVVASTSTPAWPGPPTTGWGWPRPRSSPWPATWPATSGPRGCAVNLVAAGPIRTMAAKSIPSFAAFEDTWGERAPLGWDVTDAEPVARACVALLSDWFPATTGEMVHVDGGVHAMGA